MTADFDAFLHEIGVTRQDMEQAARQMPEPLPKLPGEAYTLAPSAIHGTGTFACRALERGDDIALLKVGGGWTQAGRYMNHDASANCAAYFDGNVRIRALMRIDSGDELTVDYRQVRDLLSRMGGE